MKTTFAVCNCNLFISRLFDSSFMSLKYIVHSYECFVEYFVECFVECFVRISFFFGHAIFVDMTMRWSAQNEFLHACSDVIKWNPYILLRHLNDTSWPLIDTSKISTWIQKCGCMIKSSAFEWKTHKKRLWNRE